MVEVPGKRGLPRGKEGGRKEGGKEGVGSKGRREGGRERERGMLFSPAIISTRIHPADHMSMPVV